MVFDKMFSFCFFAHPSKIAFLLLSIFYKSFPIQQSESAYKKKEQKVVFTPLLLPPSQACPFFKAFSKSTCYPLHLQCPPHHKKKEIDSQPTPPNPPAACPTGPKPLHLQSYTIYILYFVVIAQKVFNDLELTRTISLISLSKLPLFFCPGSLKIKSALFSRDLIQQERVQCHYLLLQYTYTIYNIYYITPYEHLFVHCGYPILQHRFWVEKICLLSYSVYHQTKIVAVFIFKSS